jgi:hypothetical protein
MHIVKAVSFKVASTLMFAIMGAQVRIWPGRIRKDRSRSSAPCSR